MELLINHLTRMRPGFMCVAGIDLATGHHVRPIVQGGQLTTAFLRRHGGPFDIGAVVDLGLHWRIGRPPEMEDYLFIAEQAAATRTATPDEFWHWHTVLARPSLQAIFGPDLLPRGARACGVDVGRGRASLGCLRPRQCDGLHARPRPGQSPQVRVHVADGAFDLDLSVTDVRLFGADHVTPDDAVIQRIDHRLQSADEVLLCVGLTRAFQPTHGAAGPPLHWLQVTNVHFRGDPLWQLG